MKILGLTKGHWIGNLSQNPFVTIACHHCSISYSVEKRCSNSDIFFAGDLRRPVLVQEQELLYPAAAAQLLPAQGEAGLLPQGTMHI